jgi:diguanylate cyclase (GGDEF)-like protein/PAS domain S-box-containing protein
MRSDKKHAIFLLPTILLFFTTFKLSSNISAILCTLWIIIVIIHYGMKGGLVFTLFISADIIYNFFAIPSEQSFFPIMGIITYLSMSIGIGLPIDLMRKQQASRIASEERLRRITNNIQDVIVQLDRNGIIQYISPSCYKNFGQPSEFYIGKSFYSQMHPDDRPSISKKIEDAFLGKGLELMQYRYGEEYDSYIWMESLGQVIICDKHNRDEIVINCRDITERKKTEEKIAYLSYHDTLTGLYNRAYYEEFESRLIQENILPLSIIIGDVNGLKLTNDVFGHYEGDKLLIKTANILRECCRKEDIVVRWGGDEFAILLPGANKEAALEVIRKIHTRCDEASSEPIKISIALGSATKKAALEEMKNIVKEAEEKMYRHKLLESRSAKSNIIASLEETLLERSYETKEHTTRMKEIALMFGKDSGLPENELDELSLLATLHDIGKIAIKDSILGKSGKLTEDEWQEMKKHPEIGYRIAQSTKELCHISDYILGHHERWDGSGYPQGLAGKAIPKLARIISIIDSYDAMTSSRSYKDGISHRDAIEEIESCSGTQFDPELAAAFIQSIQAYRINKE